MGNAKTNQGQNMTTKTEKTPTVGQIFYSSWGYDQTNVDFYQVMKVTKTMITIQKMHKSRASSEHDQCLSVTPTTINHNADPIRRKWRVYEYDNSDFYCSLNSYSGAYSWDGTPRLETDPRYGH